MAMIVMMGMVAAPERGRLPHASHLPHAAAGGGHTTDTRHHLTRVARLFGAHCELWFHPTKKRLIDTPMSGKDRSVVMPPRVRDDLKITLS